MSNETMTHAKHAADDQNNDNKNEVKKEVNSEKTRSHTVSKGDTIRKLAERYGVRASAIEKLNKLDDPNVLVIGNDIKIPN